MAHYNIFKLNIFTTIIPLLSNAASCGMWDIDWKFISETGASALNVIKADVFRIFVLFFFFSHVTISIQPHLFHWEHNVIRWQHNDRLTMLNDIRWIQTCIERNWKRQKMKENDFIPTNSNRKSSRAKHKKHRIMRPIQRSVYLSIYKYTMWTTLCTNWIWFINFTIARMTNRTNFTRNNKYWRKNKNENNDYVNYKFQCPFACDVNSRLAIRSHESFVWIGWRYTGTRAENIFRIKSIR